MGPRARLGGLMTDRVAQWASLLDRLYPVADAETWDSVGLQVGDPADEVSAVLVCLDVTAATIAETIDRGAQLLLAHHPLLFRPLERLTPASAAGRLALQAARGGVSVVAAHTNFDAAVDGTTRPIVDALGLTDVQPLLPLRAGGDTVKLAVFVPQEATAAVMDAAFVAGGGQIGEYDDCSFRVLGTGSFRPSAQANPTVGARERRNEVTEERLEVVVPRWRMSSVIEAVVAAHPYEEVALDVYPLEPTPRAPARAKGLGRLGRLPHPMTVGAVAQRLRTALPSPHLRVAGDVRRDVTRVAACGGAGDSLIGAAIAADAELYITGDLRHHPTLDAMTQGLALIDAGHYATEAPAMASLIDRLQAGAADHGLTARLLASETSTEPWADVPDEEEPPL